MTATAIMAELAPLGWLYVAKSRKAYYPTAAGRIYLQTHRVDGTAREAGQLAATLSFTPTVPLSDLAKLGADIAAASQSAQQVANIILASAR